MDKFSKTLAARQMVTAIAAVFMALASIGSAEAAELDHRGAKHNGAFLTGSKQSVGNAGILVHLKLTCAKNNGGKSYGDAVVYVVNVNTGEVKEASLGCSVAGPDDPFNSSRIRRAAGKARVYVHGAQVADQVEIAIVMDHNSKSNIDVLKKRLKDIIKADLDRQLKLITDPSPETVIKAIMAVGGKVVKL